MSLVTEIVILAADCFVPGTDDLALVRELVGGDLIDELGVLDEIVGVLVVEAVFPERGPTTVSAPPNEQGLVAPVPAHVNLVLGEP